MDPEDLFREIFRQQGMAGGGGGGGFGGGDRGGSSGIHFSSFGGGGGRGGGGPQMINLSLPEPFATIWKVVSRVVPGPFLVLGTMFFAVYAFSWVMGLILRNIIYVFLLSYAPIPHPSLKTFAWVAFFVCGLLGYI